MALPTKPIRKAKKVTKPKRRSPKKSRGVASAAKAASSVSLPPTPQSIRLAELARRAENAAKWKSKDTPTVPGPNSQNTSPTLLSKYKIKAKKLASVGYYCVLAFQNRKLVDIKNIPDIVFDEQERPSISSKKKLFPVFSTGEYLYFHLDGQFTKSPNTSLKVDCERVAAPLSDSKMPRLEDFEGYLLGENARPLLDKLLAPVRQRAERRKATSLKGASTDQVGALISGLSRRSLTELRQMWLNAIEKMDRSRDDLKRSIDRLVKAIEEEWSRRGAIGAVESDDFFKWPSTEANPSKNSLGEFEAPGQGVLGYLEYHVGKTNGLPTKARRTILERVFTGKLPPVFDKKYLLQWGEPNTARRLQKMAESIAAFSRNFKRRDDDKLDQAIREWESDLLFLFEQYYVGKFRFAWPTTKIG